MSWIECVGEGSVEKCPLPPKLRQRALTFAYLAKEVYSYNKGQVKLIGATRKQEWTDLLACPQESAKAQSLAKLQILLGKLFGFNAAVYTISSPYDSGVVIAFEGTHGNIRTPKSVTGLADTAADIVNCAVDIFGTDLPVNIGDAFNKLEVLFPFGVFTKLLNPRRAPGTQYDLADLVTSAVKDKYKSSSIYLTGHSLGGGLAQYAAVRHGLKAVVFNSAGVGFDRSADKTGKSIARFRTVSNLLNDTITTTSQVLSRQYGFDYTVGIGGHAMDDVIACLR